MASKSLSVGRGWAQGSYVQEPTDSQGGARRGSNLLAEPDTGGGPSALLWLHRLDFLQTTSARPFPKHMSRSEGVTFLVLLGLPHPQGPMRSSAHPGHSRTMPDLSLEFSLCPGLPAPLSLSPGKAGEVSVYLSDPRGLQSP